MPETSEINQSLSALEGELTKLKTATDEIEKAKDFAQTSILESKELLTLASTDLESNLSALSAHIEDYKHLSEQLLRGAQENDAQVIKETKIMHQAALDLYNHVDKLMEKIDKIDFPNRLDKLDTAVTGINTALQNVFGRFETVERNLKDEIQAQTDKTEKTITTSEKNLRKALLDDLELKYTKASEGFEKFRTRNLVLFSASLVLSLASLLILLIKFVF